MRTTLTLAPDVAALLRRLLKTENISLKEAVNRALRDGLTRPAPRRPSRPAARTRVVDLGGCRLNQIDDVAEALALAEGEAFP